jgi:hypothetical protein
MTRGGPGPGSHSNDPSSCLPSIFPLLGPPPSFLFSPFKHPKSTMTDMYDGKKGEPFEGTLEPYPHNELGVEVSSSCLMRSLHSSRPRRCPPLGVSGRAYAL